MESQNEYAVAGMNIVRCTHKYGNGQRCDGHQKIQLTLDELAEIRAAGRGKAVTANFSCGHKIVDKVILSR